MLQIPPPKKNKTMASAYLQANLQCKKVTDGRRHCPGLFSIFISAGKHTVVFVYFTALPRPQAPPPLIYVKEPAVKNCFFLIVFPQDNVRHLPLIVCASSCHGLDGRTGRPRQGEEEEEEEENKKQTNIGTKVKSKKCELIIIMSRVGGRLIQKKGGGAVNGQVA